MNKELFQLIQKLHFDELTELKKYVTELIDKKKQEKRGKRKEDRIAVLIQGLCTIERELEFFTVSHKVFISNISTSGICFKTSALIFPGDVLTLNFRSPATGRAKDIYAEVLRIGKQEGLDGMIEVAAKGIDIKRVMAYRKMLNERIEANKV